MEDLLISTLETFGYPVIRQGSMDEKEKYPHTFFTFWNNGADGGSFYDDDEHSTKWYFDLNLYSRDPEIVSSKLVEAKKKLKEVGFSVYGKGYDLPSDEPTHIGRGIDVIYYEYGGN